jgi:hypothetical protein
MTTKIEDIAKKYLLSSFEHDVYAFHDKGPKDNGFDLWLLDKHDDLKTKVELKAHSGIYQRPSNLFERLIFNAEIEKELFETGESVIARVFIGQEPYSVFIITNGIFGSGAKLKPEARYVIRGKINYENTYTQIA